MKIGDKAIITKYQFGFQVGTEVTLKEIVSDYDPKIWRVENNGKKWLQNEGGMILINRLSSYIKRLLTWLLKPFITDYSSSHFRREYFKNTHVRDFKLVKGNSI